MDEEANPKQANRDLAPIDEVRPDAMNVSIGDAFAQLEDCVEAAAAWRAQMADKGVTDDSVKQLLQAWIDRTALALQTIYKSKAAVLRFIISKPQISVDPFRGHLENVFNHKCRALLDERDALLALRERIAIAANQLAEQLARHRELLEQMRVSDTMTQELWQRLVANPSLSPAASRLANLGIAQAAVWDLMKATFSALG